MRSEPPKRSSASGTLHTGHGTDPTSPANARLLLSLGRPALSSSLVLQTQELTSSPPAYRWDTEGPTVEVTCPRPQVEPVAGPGLDFLSFQAWLRAEHWWSLPHPAHTPPPLPTEIPDLNRLGALWFQPLSAPSRWLFVGRKLAPVCSWPWFGSTGWCFSNPVLSPLPQPRVTVAGASGCSTSIGVLQL